MHYDLQGWTKINVILDIFFSVLDNISCLTIFEKHQYFQTTVIPALQLDRLRWCLSISMKTKTLSFYAHNTALLVLNIQVGSIFFVFCFLVGHWFCLYVGVGQCCLYPEMIA